MSWKVINEIIGMAILDSEFCQNLLAHPIETIEAAGYKLTEREREVLTNIHVDSIHEFSKRLLAELK